MALGKCKCGEQDYADIMVCKSCGKKYENFPNGILFGRENYEDFEPTKSYLMNHKGEYVIRLVKLNQLETLDCFVDLHFDDYEENLTTKLAPQHRNWCGDVKAIYKLVPYWQREEAKEMTLAEIEEELGYKVKLKEED